MFDSKKIIEETIKNWNSLSEENKIKQGKRYSHLFYDKKVKWDIEFSKLNSFQKKLLIKKTFINYYDSLNNVQKTLIKRECDLTTFASKWYKLPNSDKKIILSILFNNL